MNNYNEPVEIKKSTIDRLFDEQTNLIDGLMEKISILESRLQPIVVPIPIAEKGKEQVTITYSPLAETLFRNNRRIDNAISSVGYLLDAIQL